MTQNLAWIAQLELAAHFGLNLKNKSIERSVEMTIFYFTSTGNCLAVAKKIGGLSQSGSKLISIPQVIDKDNLSYKDDVIGLIYPIYGFGLPKMVRKFLNKVQWQANYVFAIGTYGNLPGASARNVQRLAKKHGLTLDYSETLLMVDNYLPGYDINNQIAKLTEKKTEENLAWIIENVGNHTRLKAKATLLWRMLTAMLKSGEKLMMNGKQGQSYIINNNCIKCGICAKVCPSGNISVSARVTFSDKCEGCLGCVHLCPQNAIHLKSEQSTKRWLHPDVSLKEIIAANNRTQ
jgi:ferredoxin/flavodoxin